MRHGGTTGWRRGVGVLLVLSLGFGAVPRAQAFGGGKSNTGDLIQQITTDLVGAGVTVGATLSGSVPLALMAGYLTKYITSYGISGVRALVDSLRTRYPRDLGEVNLYYLYLINVKRNLYQTLISIRKSVQSSENLEQLQKEITDIEKSLQGECDLKTGCSVGSLEDRLINYQFLNIALDAKATLDVNKYLAANEVKATYHYLILLYLDVQIVEQKLIDAQYDILAQRVHETMGVLRDNPYLSNAEKEFQFQQLMNLTLRWRWLADSRRKILYQSIQQPLAALKAENEDLSKILNGYQGE